MSIAGHPSQNTFFPCGCAACLQTPDLGLTKTMTKVQEQTGHEKHMPDGLLSFICASVDRSVNRYLDSVRSFYKLCLHTFSLLQACASGHVSKNVNGVCPTGYGDDGEGCCEAQPSY